MYISTLHKFQVCVPSNITILLKIRKYWNRRKFNEYNRINSTWIARKTKKQRTYSNGNNKSICRQNNDKEKDVQAFVATLTDEALEQAKDVQEK